VLVGLTMTLYSAVYFLFPILTNGAQMWSEKLANVHFWCHLVGGVGMGAAMGMAGLQGMMRRQYSQPAFEPYMILAAIAGSLLAVALICFLLNIAMTLGLKGAIGVFTPAKAAPATELLPGMDLTIQPVEEMEPVVSSEGSEQVQ
jgi:cytochrome c oxidase subunit 1